MSWRRITFYYLGAALVWGCLWINWQTRLAETAPEAQLSETAIVGLSPADIEKVSIRAHGLEISLFRQDEKWSVEAPAGAEVPGGLIEAIVDTLTSIPPIETISGDAAGAAEYGLDPPELTLALTDTRGARVVIEFGKRNPTGTAVYAKIEGEAELSLLGLNSRYYLDLLLEDVRESADRPGR